MSDSRVRNDSDSGSGLEYYLETVIQFIIESDSQIVIWVITGDINAPSPMYNFIANIIILVKAIKNTKFNLVVYLLIN